MKNLLNAVADKLNDFGALMGSKWQNCEAEVIASQTICACRNNLADHGDAFSWLMASATRGRAMCGTNNSAGLQRLIDDGSLIVEDYAGDLSAPSGVAVVEGKSQVLRVSDSLLLYAASHMKLKLDSLALS